MPSFDASNCVAFHGLQKRYDILANITLATDVPKLDLESYILNYRGRYLPSYASSLCKF